ncbi:MAG: peptidoglycan DD-metalloendopeptidase family protein [Campylobacter sp.]|nr:peptidoglycan DD-metalloendopeptidase family protein [Campylobacter sp.]
MVRKIILCIFMANFMFGATLTYEKFSWPSNVSFLEYLQILGIPQSLYYDLPIEDRELAAEIRAGINCDILVDENGKVYQVLIPISSELQLHISRDKSDNFRLDFTPIIYSEEERMLGIAIENSPSQDILKASGSGSLAGAFARVFRGKIDERKFKKGDMLVIVYKQKIRLGMPYDDPEILSAMVEQNKKSVYMYQFDSKFYDENGKRTDTYLFRIPIKNKYRISSKFTPKRYHPILKKYRAHLGTDYAAPRGTPVYAAGDGTVSFVGRKGGYGNTVEIKHSGGYLTLYAHLNGFVKGLKKGQRVKQGDKIAFIGTTGLSSGPHLHLGLYKNNRAIDFEKVVSTAKLDVETKERQAFKALMKTQNEKIQLAVGGAFNPDKFQAYENTVKFIQ